MKAVITVVGRDNVGIIAKVSGKLARENINIIDISQTIRGDIFSMFMIVEMPENIKFGEIADSLEELGKSIGLKIQATDEKVFDAMHRI